MIATTVCRIQNVFAMRGPVDRPGQIIQYSIVQYSTDLVITVRDERRSEVQGSGTKYQ